MRAACSFIVCALLAGCNPGVRTNQVTLSFGVGAPTGLNCTENGSTCLLIAQAITPAESLCGPTDGGAPSSPDLGHVGHDLGTSDQSRSLSVNAVVEFIDLGGGEPFCRSTYIAEWCDTHDCALLDEYRRCLHLDIPLEEKTDSGDIAAALAAGLAAQGPLTQEAPHDPVLIRVVLTMQDCSSYVSSFDENALVGCVTSCPELLDSVSSVELGGDGSTCDANDVRACAECPGPTCPR